MRDLLARFVAAFKRGIEGELAAIVADVAYFAAASPEGLVATLLGAAAM